MKKEHYNSDEQNEQSSIKGNLVDKLSKRPKQTLMFMILILTLSVIANIIWEVVKAGKKPEIPQAKTSTVTAPIGDGFGQLLNAGISIYELTALQNEVELILAKDHWTNEDSLKIKIAQQKIRDYRP